MTRNLSLESPTKALSGIVTSSLPSTILLQLVSEIDNRQRERARKEKARKERERKNMNPKCLGPKQLKFKILPYVATLCQKFFTHYKQDFLDILYIHISPFVWKLLELMYVYILVEVADPWINFKPPRPGYLYQMVSQNPLPPPSRVLISDGSSEPVAHM